MLKKILIILFSLYIIGCSSTENYTQKSDDCNNPKNVGTIGKKSACLNKIIVDNQLLREMVSLESIGYTTITDKNLINRIIKLKDKKGVLSAYDYKVIYTGQVTDLSYLFYGINNIRADISQWDVSNVTDMSGLFLESDFNQDISQWNVSKVKSLYLTFASTKNFNQPIGSWNVSNVESMLATFNNAESFNQPLKSWNMSNVKETKQMFAGTKKFNQDINNWNMSNVESISYMFADSIFNRPLNKWNVSKVRYMEGVFSSSDFNQDISNWNVSNVRNMNHMFYNNKSFNQPLACWDISNVNTALSIFEKTDKFDQKIGNWKEKIENNKERNKFENLFLLKLIYEDVNESYLSKFKTEEIFKQYLLKDLNPNIKRIQLDVCN